MDYYEDIATQIIAGKITTAEQLQWVKIKLCQKYKLDHLPRNSEILGQLSPDMKSRVAPLLRKKPMRTISGIAPVAVMTSPAPCPHGKCIYCPGGVEFGTAQSYTGREPAALRARANDYDPFKQVRARIEQLAVIGHPTDKIELIIMGGTFTARAPTYQDWFIKRCFDALNFDKPSVTLSEAQLRNETAPHRCTGLTIETRPDWCLEPQVDKILYQGGTRVELGVQSLSDKVLARIARGHTVATTIESTRILKDAGLKVCYHMMPSLPGATYESDLAMFKQIISDPKYRPDMLKIYPTIVIKGTKLYDLWLQKKYVPLEQNAVVKLIAVVKSWLPRWLRIQRIQRDIPVQLITAGIKHSNLRQLVNLELTAMQKSCECIRCREVGHKFLKGILPELANIKLREDRYVASEGEERFLTYEDIKNNILVGYIRVRLPSELAHRPEVRSTRTAIIRELRVLGQMLRIGELATATELEKWQHFGFGKKLVHAAETLAIDDWDVKKILVLSGVGVKDYYRRLGYTREGVYMAKLLAT
jgi:elongator complex protein 3